MSDVNGIPITTAQLAMAEYGSWRAEVTCSSGEAPSGEVTLTMGALELAGTVLRGGNDSVDRPHMVIVGAPGWERPLAEPMSYQSDGGVRLKTVLADLAGRAQEQIEQPSDTPLGAQFQAIPSPTAKLRDVLAALKRAGHVEHWRVDPDGVTRFGARTGEDATDQGHVLSFNAALGLYKIGVEELGPFLPSNEIDGATIKRIVAHETSGRLMLEAWT